MPTLPTRPIAPGLNVSILGLGGTGLGNMYSAVDAAEAERTVQTALAGGITYYDLVSVAPSDVPASMWTATDSICAEQWFTRNSSLRSI